MRPPLVTRPDRHILYEAAVQDIDFDLRFFGRIYRRLRGRPFTNLREDFCGTARLACEWVRRGKERRAMGVDLNGATLEWSRRHHLPRIGAAAERLLLVQGDVRTVRGMPADVIAALNCSYWVFKRRRELVDYFRRARTHLRPQGLFILDVFGGDDAMNAHIESRRVRGARSYAGERVPAFRYTWEQKNFNPVDHHLLCHIHFELDGGRRFRRAFTYDWRMWTLPELDEALREAGFVDVQVYVQAWDDERHEPTNFYRRRGGFENQQSWIAMVVGVK